MDSEVMRAKIQEFLDEAGREGLVSSFLLVAELDIPSTPEDPMYLVVRTGTTATQLGLSVYLDEDIRSRSWGEIDG